MGYVSGYEHEKLERPQLVNTVLDFLWLIICDQQAQVDARS